MKSIGIAIPCYHGHVPNLKKLLDSIEKQTRVPDMVAISCSGVEEVPYKEEDYSFPLKFILTKDKKNAAQNRNIAGKYLNTDIISFMDADDQIHPQRTEIIEKVFSYPIHLFVHNLTFDKEFKKFYDLNKFPFDLGTLSVNYWGLGVGSINTPNTFNYLKKQLEPVNFAQGHCTVSKEAFETVIFREGPDNQAKEDSVFTAEVCSKYPQQNAYCPLELSIYEPSRTHSFVP